MCTGDVPLSAKLSALQHPGNILKLYMRWFDVVGNSVSCNHHRQSFVAVGGAVLLVSPERRCDSPGRLQHLRPESHAKVPREVGKLKYVCSENAHKGHSTYQIMLIQYLNPPRT